MSEGREEHAAGPEAVEGYRPVSTAALAALLLGAASPLAMFNPVFLFLPCLGAVFAVLALGRSLRRSPHLLGRKAAIAGLLLSLACGSAVVADAFVYRAVLEREAAATGLEWFALLAQDQPHKAFQLTLPPNERQRWDDQRPLWSLYRINANWRAGLDVYVRDPAVRTLLALGEKAEVRYCGLEDAPTLGDKETLKPRFAVTFDDAGKKKTFFIVLPMQRVRRSDGQAEWQVYRPRTGAEIEPW